MSNDDLDGILAPTGLKLTTNNVQTGPDFEIERDNTADQTNSKFYNSL